MFIFENRLLLCRVSVEFRLPYWFLGENRCWLLIRIGWSSVLQGNVCWCSIVCLWRVQPARELFILFAYSAVAWSWYCWLQLLTWIRQSVLIGHYYYRFKLFPRTASRNSKSERNWFGSPSATLFTAKYRFTRWHDHHFLWNSELYVHWSHFWRVDFWLCLWCAQRKSPCTLIDKEDVVSYWFLVGEARSLRGKGCYLIACGSYWMFRLFQGFHMKKIMADVNVHVSSVDWAIRSIRFKILAGFLLYSIFKETSTFIKRKTECG